MREGHLDDQREELEFDGIKLDKPSKLDDKGKEFHMVDMEESG